MLEVQSERTGPVTDDEKQFFVALGGRIGDRRREQGLTQGDLAEYLGVSQQTVNSFERGRRRVPVSALPILSQRLGLDFDELITGNIGPERRRGPVSRLQRQMDEIRDLPRAKQKLIIEMIEVVLGQDQRANS